MDLFSHVRTFLPGTPLPEVLRPSGLKGFVGHPQIKSQIERYLKQGGHFPSMIFWGPSGSGKTTLARIISNLIDADFINQQATDTGAKSLKEQGEKGKENRQRYGRKTLLFVDEIHRLNKAQQDVILPYIENGDLSLIGATTENPAYELNRALLSRCKILIFQKLAPVDLEALFDRAMRQKSREQLLTDEARRHLINWSDGDARRLLNAVEELLLTFTGDSLPVDCEGLCKVLGGSVPHYDKDSDQHYDIISAFIKSLRGSDADAALYWLARMIRGGESPTFIARRLIIFASEDVGNADPKGLGVAVAAAQAVDQVGWPEAAINLAHATTYLACAPKSNRSYLALKNALDLVDQTGSLTVPLHLRSSRTDLMQSLGYGKGYSYPHDFDRGFIQQSYSPDGVALPRLYEPSEIGFEKVIQQYQKWQKGEK